jgi:tRNA dimethylallyltransferase
MNYDTIVILGPTASGKTLLGVGVAREVGGEIISADSRRSTGGWTSARERTWTSMGRRRIT